MHDGEADIDAGLVQRLVAAQFPRLASLPVREFGSTGTVNAIYRLGDQMYARLPRVPRYVSALERELRWLPELAPGLTLRIPVLVAPGQPTAEYRVAWVARARTGTGCCWRVTWGSCTPRSSGRCGP